jgi:hypothetical protein
MKRLEGHWPLVAILTLYCVVVAALVASDTRANDGHFIYALDDAYIHLAIARTLSHHHVWGPTLHHFSSSSSSILWTLLLAASASLELPFEWMPLVWNVVSGCALLVFVDRSLTRRAIEPATRSAILVALVFAAPFPALTLAGMEHLLHALLVTAFLEMATREWANPPGAGLSTDARWLLALGPLSVAARYESVFLVATVCAAFVFQKKRPLFAVAVGALALLPIVVFGLYSLRNGALFFPNSVLLKGNAPGLSLASLARAARAPVLALSKSPETLILLLTTLALLAWPRRLSPRTRFSLGTLVIITLAHVLLARFGHFFRYEAYLFALFVFVAAPALVEARGPDAAPLDFRADPRARWGALLAACAAFPLVLRGAVSLAETPRATHEIYQQQYQTARFVKAFYPEAGVAANDIGLIAYGSSHTRLLDLWGLASLDVLQARRSGVYDSAKIDAITRAAGASVAIVYDSWFEEMGGLPATWKRVAQLTVPTRFVLGDDTVSLYAVDPAEAPRLAEHLAAFAAQLPSTVSIKWPKPSPSCDPAVPPTLR